MFTVVYGITASTKMFIDSEFNSGKNIFACTAGGEFFEGIPALSINEIKDFGIEKIDRVVICSEFVSDILQSLSEIGISSDICYFFNHMREQLILCKDLKEDLIDPNNVLHAFYDLRVNLPCFDAITFIVLSEQARINREKKYIQFYIVHDREKTKAPTHVFHNKNDSYWRLDKIVKPLFSCLNSYLSTVDIVFREDISNYVDDSCETYPTNYLANHKIRACSFDLLKSLALKNVKLSCISPPHQASDMINLYMDETVKNKKLIAITLREYWANAKERNSDLQSWAKFIHWLDKEKYYPLIIRDTYFSSLTLPEYFGDTPTLQMASIDLHLRYALYQKAYINLGIESGPLFGISFIKDAKFIIFRPTDDRIPNLSTHTHERHGFTVGENHVFNDNQFQINAWCYDTYDNIVNEFLKLEAKIELSTKGIAKI